MRRTRAASLLVALAGMAASALPASETALPAKEFTVSFIATDKQGRVRSDLSAADFEIRVGKRPVQRVTALTVQERRPLRLIALLDGSGSTGQTGVYIREEMLTLIRFLRQNVRPGIDKAAIIAFDDKTWLECDMTDEPDKLEKAILKIPRAAGGTALHDALVAAADYVTSQPDEQRGPQYALILLSDGADTSSKATLKKATAAVLRAGVTIYSMNTGEQESFIYSMNTGEQESFYRYQYKGERILRELARATGGMAFRPKNAKDVKPAFQQIEADISASRYVVRGEMPSASSGSSDGFHRIKIKPKVKDVELRAPEGFYLAP